MTESNKCRILVLVTAIIVGGTYIGYEILRLQHFSFISGQKLQLSLPPIINCSTVGFDPVSTVKIPIYDFFLFDHELDILEIRLYELYHHVTLFLIAESDRTFSGKPKPLYLKENWSRFTKYHDKIRRVEVNLTDLKDNLTNSWSREDKSRNDGVRLALPKSSEY